MGRREGRGKTEEKPRSYHGTRASRFRLKCMCICACASEHTYMRTCPSAPLQFITHEHKCMQVCSHLSTHAHASRGASAQMELPRHTTATRRFSDISVDALNSIGLPACVP